MSVPIFNQKRTPKRIPGAPFWCSRSSILVLQERPNDASDDISYRTRFVNDFETQFEPHFGALWTSFRSLFVKEIWKKKRFLFYHNFDRRFYWFWHHFRQVLGPLLKSRKPSKQEKRMQLMRGGDQGSGPSTVGYERGCAVNCL